MNSYIWHIAVVKTLLEGSWPYYLTHYIWATVLEYNFLDEIACENLAHLHIQKQATPGIWQQNCISGPFSRYDGSKDKVTYHPIRFRRPIWVVSMKSDREIIYWVSIQNYWILGISSRTLNKCRSGVNSYIWPIAVVETLLEGIWHYFLTHYIWEKVLKGNFIDEKVWRFPRYTTSKHTKYVISGQLRKHGFSTPFQVRCPCMTVQNIM